MNVFVVGLMQQQGLFILINCNLKFCSESVVSDVVVIKISVNKKIKIKIKNKKKIKMLIEYVAALSRILSNEFQHMSGAALFY